MKLRSLVRPAAVAAALLGAPAGAWPQAKEPLTHETLFLMKRVGPPAASPDGKWVAFSVTEPSYDEKKEVSDLWIVPADGSAPPRRLTSSKGGESAPDWSPDSRQAGLLREARRRRGRADLRPRRRRRRRGAAHHERPRWPRDRRCGAPTGAPSPSRARPTRGRRTPRRTRRSRPSGRTRSRRSASTTASPSAAGTSGSTTPRPICSWSPPTAAKARARPARGHRRSSRCRASAAPAARARPRTSSTSGRPIRGRSSSPP